MGHVNVDTSIISDGEKNTNLGFPCTFVYFSTFEYTIELKASILIDRGKDVEIQMPAPHPRSRRRYYDGRKKCLP